MHDKRDAKNVMPPTLAYLMTSQREREREREGGGGGENIVLYTIKQKPYGSCYYQVT